MRRGSVFGMMSAVLLIAAAPAALQTGAQQRWPLTVRPIVTPAGADAAQPQLSVSKRGVILSWIERAGRRATLKFAERRGPGWSEARAVASGDDWFVNWADVPSVIRLADGTLVAHWLQKSGPGTYAYDVRLSYSADEGRTWAASFTPHSDGTKTEHGFASLLAMPRAGVGVLWLDGRAMSEGHGEDGRGDMSVRFTTFGPDWKQTAEHPVDLRVCECCPTTAAVTDEGLIVAYRDRTADEVRDIHVARLVRGRWTEPAAVHQDGWRIPACPVNGPVLSARGRTVAIAWFTAATDGPQSYVAFSKDSGRTFGAPIRLSSDASLGRVDIELLPDGSAAASYLESANERTEFRVRRIEASGKKSEPITVAVVEGSRASGYPRLALHENELVFAWVERQGSLQVRSAIAALPATASPSRPAAPRRR